MPTSIIIISYILLSHSIYSNVNSYLDKHAGSKTASITTYDGSRILRISWRNPNEYGWVGYRNNNISDIGNAVRLIKSENPFDDNKYENQEIEVYITHRDLSSYNDIKFLDQKIIRNIQEYYENNKEYNLQFINVGSYTENKDCFKIHILLEYARYAGDHKQKKWNEQHALSCHFPVSRNIGFEFRYYHRYYDNNNDHYFSDKAEKLFKSIKVEDKISDEFFDIINFSMIAFGIIPIQYYTIKPPLY